jgi:hypothetical protein
VLAHPAHGYQEEGNGDVHGNVRDLTRRRERPEELFQLHTIEWVVAEPVGEPIAEPM